MDSCSIAMRQFTRQPFAGRPLSTRDKTCSSGNRLPHCKVAWRAEQAEAPTGDLLASQGCSACLRQLLSAPCTAAMPLRPCRRSARYVVPFKNLCHEYLPVVPPSHTPETPHACPDPAQPQHCSRQPAPHATAPLAALALARHPPPSLPATAVNDVERTEVVYRKSHGHPSCTSCSSQPAAATPCLCQAAHDMGGEVPKCDVTRKVCTVGMGAQEKVQKTVASSKGRGQREEVDTDTGTGWHCRRTAWRRRRRARMWSLIMAPVSARLQWHHLHLCGGSSAAAGARRLAPQPSSCLQCRCASLTARTSV